MTYTKSTSFFALLGQMVARAWRVYKNRRQFNELTHWSDEQLNDIGLTRYDVKSAIETPFYIDPTAAILRSNGLETSAIVPVSAAANIAKTKLSIVSSNTTNDDKIAA